MTRARVLAGLLLLLMTGLAQAEAKDNAEALANATKIRAALPAPSPVVSFLFEGDVVLNGLWAGEITLTLKASKVGRDLVWRATEKLFTDWKGIETRRSTILHLKQDLSIVSGSAELKREDETTALVISRTDKGFFIQRRHKKGEDWQAPELLQMEAPKSATHGLVPVLFFLRHVPADDKTTYEIPRVRWPWSGEPKAVDALSLEVTGEAPTLPGSEKERKTWAAIMRSAGEVRGLHLSPDRTSFVGSVVADKPEALRIVPRGEGGERNKLSEKVPAKTWQDAFLKFGYGYHQARRKLLDAAFHWDRFYEHETTVLKRWNADKPVEEFKQAWIDEFCAQSKHRSDANTQRLLDMTLATGKLKKKTDDSVVFAAHANFGGGTQRTYFLERRDGYWGIVRIDW